MQAVHANGDFFLNDNGTEFHYVGLSDFALLKRWYAYGPTGPEALVRPIFQERRSIAERAGYHGPLVFRVFKYGSPTNAFGGDPWAYDMACLDGLAKMAAEFNSYIDYTTGDSQIVLPDMGDQQHHLDASEAAIKVFHFVETCNEPFKNGIDVARVKPAKTPLNCRDSGAYGEIGGPHGEGWPMDTILDYVSYHGTRDGHPSNRFPKWVMDLDDQIGVIRSALYKPPVLKEPIGFEKNEIPGRRYNDPFLARLLGQRASMGGVCFHSTLGLSSDGFDDQTKNAFYEYCRGAAGALA